ncbi:MAG TPA: DUF4258 domain-containing protein [Candidatus Latescibacteria bacterium]|nr:DUF4258 domain-containing protein [Candidatus Latescibacterota bacterium]
MRTEERGPIREEEVFEAIQVGEVIESYEDDKPYPSILVYGRTAQGRPLHLVCAYAEEEDLAIVITAYEPDPLRWIGYRERR